MKLILIQSLKSFSYNQFKRESLLWGSIFLAYSFLLTSLFIFRFISLDHVENNYIIYHIVFCSSLIILLSATTIFFAITHHINDYLLLFFIPFGLCTMEAINQYGRFQMCTDIFGQVFHFTILSLFLIDVKMLLLSFFDNPLKNKIVKYVFSIIEFLLWLMIIIIILNRIVSGACIDTDAIDAICQTHFSEAISYFFHYNNGFIILVIFIIFIILFILLIIYLSSQSSQYPKWMKWIALILLFILISINYLGEKAHYYTNYMPYTYIMLCEPYNYMQALKKFTYESNQRANMLSNYKQSQDFNVSGEDGLFVLIIGESTCRNYMSCYGYSQNTTPYQDKLRYSGQAIFFDNAYSSHVITIHAVPMMITAKNQYLPPQKETLETNISLVDLANINNYQTAWLSNQPKKEFIITVIGQSAQINIFLSEEIKNEHYDNDLITAFQKIQGDWTRALVIFHLAGTHFPYDYSYPSNHSPFPQDFKSYEKAIYFNDENIEKLVECLKQYNASVIAYVSDHADAVSLMRAHDSRPEFFHKEMTEIPFWIYFSQEYQEQHPELISTLKSNAKVPITNDIIFNIFLQLMNISAPLSPPEYSPTSPDYILKSQAIKTLNSSMIMLNGEWHPSKGRK